MKKMLGIPIYLDYQATTPLDPRVGEAMRPYWSESFGNPHSHGHRFGWDAAEAIGYARGQVANLIGADDKDIIFVSGATESCNLALRGMATSDSKRNGIITVTTEHPAVLETVRDLARRGFDVVEIPVKSSGLIDLSELSEALDSNTLIVSVMLANNEIGVIQPLREISEMAHSVGAFVHTDATQAVGRTHVDVDDLDVDLLSMSGHKIYGPNGIGVLFARNLPELNLRPVITGGSQERGLRPGTVPTPLVVGLGEACELISEEIDSDCQRITKLTDHLCSELFKSVSNIRLFGDPIERVPGNLNMGVPGVLAEQLVDAVSARIAISTGSACSTGSPEPSHIIMALGFSEETAATAVRISIGRFTTKAEIDTASEILRISWNSIGGSK